MSRSYYTAAIQEPRIILGLRLRELSLGHIVLLNRVESAFLSGEKILYEDLAVSVFICAMNYADGVAALDDNRLQRNMLRWSQLLTRTRAIDRLLFRKPRPIEFHDKVAEFNEYLKAGSWHPDFASASEGTPIGLPSEHVIRVVLMRDMGFREEEIMDRSWSKCLTDFYTLRALDGSGEIRDNDALNAFMADKEQIAAIAKIAEEMKKR